RSGIKKDGTLTFREVNTLLDNGGYTSWGATTPFVMMQTFSSLYRVPHCNYQTKVVYTNNVFSGSFRGYGNLQATFALESQMDRLAEKCGINPLEIRKKNAQYPGEITPQGLDYSTCGFQECIDTATDSSNYLEKYEQNLVAQKENKSHIKKGIGMASLLHVGGGAKIYGTDGCGTILKIDDFANVTIITGSSEIGQGSETVLSQFVGEVLGLPVTKMKVVNNDTDVCPWDVGVHASRTTFIAGNSAIRAANKAKKKILDGAAELYKLNAEDLDLRGEHIVMDSDGEVVVSLGKFIRALHFSTKFDMIITSDYYEPPSESQDRSFKGNVSASYAFGTQVIELEVDTDTGEITVDKITAAHDVGKVINPMGIEGQLEGGLIMGVGYALTEQLLLKEGVVQNPNFRDYKLITAPEVPEMDLHFIETNDPEGPCGAKGMAEAPAIPTAAAIANALFNATGIHFRDLPLTPEKVLKRLKEYQREHS
ncbi:MAG: molybdopterin-dependent oxidoreductase, partial [Gammaproteobacteria bacterium]|nr:molybdopterin-dependent oxidoreductase [Gammaproteobacteria bacterium]